MTDPRPTPEQIDDLCLAFNDAKWNYDSAASALSTAKGELLALIEKHGATPARADKTLRLEGSLFVADATTSTTVEINDAKIEELQSELSRMKKPSLFRKLFTRTVKFKIVEAAPKTLELAVRAMPTPAQNRLNAIFAQCFKVNPTAPRLSVEEIAIARKKEETAAKREKKATRKGGK